MSEVSNHSQTGIDVLKPQKKSHDFYFSPGKGGSREAGTQKPFLLWNSKCSLGPVGDQTHVQEPQQPGDASHTALTGLLGPPLGVGIS